MTLPLSAIIEHLRPGAVAGRDFDVLRRTGGEEVFIAASWRAAGVPPSGAEIEGGRVAAAASLHVRAVKAEAHRRIVAVYPEWQQRNMTARGVALLSIGEVDWTADQAAEAAALDAAWAWVERVRAASDAIEVDLAADPQDSVLWPEEPAV